MAELMIHHIFDAVFGSFNQSFIERYYTFIRQTAAPTGRHIAKFQLRIIHSIRNEFLMNFVHYFAEDNIALLIKPVVEKVLFSVIIVGTSYMNVNIYASTTAILTAALKAVKLAVRCEEVPVNDGNIIRIDSDGKLSVSTFEAQVQHFDWHYLYRLYGYDFEDKDEDYTNDLLMICGCYGVAREDVELLLELGYSTDEIEEMLLDSDLFEQTMNEVKTLYQR